MNIKTGFKSIDKALAGGLKGGEIAVLAGSHCCDNLFLNMLYNLALDSKQANERNIVYLLNHAYLQHASLSLFPSLSVPEARRRENIVEFKKMYEKFESLNIVKGLVDERLMLTSVDKFMKFHNPLKGLCFNGSCEPTALSAIFMTTSAYTHNYLKVIKDVAIKLNVPVIIFTGVKEGIEYKNNYTPKISDIKNYTHYVNYADKFMIMYRESKWSGIKCEDGFSLDKKIDIVKNKVEKVSDKILEIPDNCIKDGNKRFMNFQKELEKVEKEQKDLEERLAYWKNKAQIICYNSAEYDPSIVELNFCSKPVDDIFYYQEIV